MAANNYRGIAHVRHLGQTLCKARAHVAVSIDKFRSEPRQCVRCAAKLAKIDAMESRQRA